MQSYHMLYHLYWDVIRPMVLQFLRSLMTTTHYSGSEQSIFSWWSVCDSSLYRFPQYYFHFAILASFSPVWIQSPSSVAHGRSLNSRMINFTSVIKSLTVFSTSSQTSCICAPLSYLQLLCISRLKLSSCSVVCRFSIFTAHYCIPTLLHSSLHVKYLI